MKSMPPIQVIADRTYPADDEGHYEASPCPSARSAFRARTTIAAAAIFDQAGLDDGASPSFHRVGH
jgi:hypothetical protein